MDYREQIAAFRPADEPEKRVRERVIRLIEQKGDALLERTCGYHFTGSALLLNPSGSKTLLLFHKQFQSWTYPGGHADGDRDLLAVALREAREETGLSALTPVREEILALDLLGVPGHRKNGSAVEAHTHISASFVLQAREEEPLRQNPAESQGLRWVPVDQLEKWCREPHMLAVFRKLLARAGAFGRREENR